MRICILDCETTGLDPEQGAVCIEVAAMAYDTKYGPVESFASLIRHDSNAAEHINRIPVGALVEAPEAARIWERVQEIWETCEAFVAHRAEFDRKFVTPGMKTISSHPGIDSAVWICTKVDVDWPGGHRGDHLVHLALAYGLGVASAHRAMTDVDHIARIFTRVAETNDLEALLRRAMRPKKRFVALVSYDMRQLAKDAGFFWDDKNREWYREMPPEDAAALSFRTVERP
jgi:DNA polymerase-3 subunit epsilon